MNADDERRLLLRAVRLGGIVDIDQLVVRCGWDRDRCTRIIAVAVDRGYLRRRDGRVQGWVLTADGRSAGQQLMSSSIAARGIAGVLRQRYLEFLGFNHDALQVCTDWQVLAHGDGESVVNRHLDEEYDAAVVERLVELHDAATPLVEALGREVEEFAGYQARFDHAVARTVAGQHEWFTRPLIDSFHTVWFELHEDLLLATGRDRADEHNGEKWVTPGAS